MLKIKKISLEFIKYLSFIPAFFVFLLTGFTKPIYAATESGWIPDWIYKIITGFGFQGEGTPNPIGQVRTRVQWGITLLFVGVFVVAIVYSALAAIKFISSQGDSSKLEESKAAVKAILMGFAAMLIAIVGIFIIVWVFDRQAQINTTPDEYWEEV